MTIGSVLLGLALLVVVGLWLARPFLMETAHESAVRHSSRRRELELQKQALLNEVRDLEFDHDTGKLPTEVFELQRDHVMKQAAAVLKEIDGLKAKRAKPKPAGVDQDIEAAIAQMRGKKPAKSAQPARPKAARPKVAPANTVTNGHRRGGFCPQCGESVDADDKFCAACGQALHAKQPA